MPNNYHHPGGTHPRETAFHAAGHLLAPRLLTQPDPPPFWLMSHFLVGDAGFIEAIAEVVTAISWEVDTSVAMGAHEYMEDVSQHLDYLGSRPHCVQPQNRSAATALLDHSKWVETVTEFLHQRHWFAVSTLAELLNMGLRPSTEWADRILLDVRCSEYARERIIIPEESDPRGSAAS